MINDFLNGFFELGGAYFAWCNTYRLWKDKEIKGVYAPAWIFFTLFGLWNLYYYPSLSQWYSFVGGIFLVLGNIGWCILAIKYRRRLYES